MRIEVVECLKRVDIYLCLVAAAEVKVDGLDSSTAYEVYVAAQRSERVVMSDKLEATTLMKVEVYDIAPVSAVSQPGSSQNNFFIVLADEQNNQLKLDLYTAEVGTYLPTAEFQPEGDNYYNTTYTMLYLDGAAEGKRFASGVIDVVAEPNEETREILYALEGHLYSSEGDYEVVFRYKGLIEGYHLPPAGLDIPEGAIYFETDADTNQPVHLKASGEPTSEIIKAEGQKLSGSEATIGGLQPETGYVVFALAVNGDRKAVTAQEFVTAESEFDGY